jgi:hypothetical protein
MQSSKTASFIVTQTMHEKKLARRYFDGMIPAIQLYGNKEGLKFFLIQSLS